MTFIIALPLLAFGAMLVMGVFSVLQTAGINVLLNLMLSIIIAAVIAMACYSVAMWGLVR